MPPIPRLLRKRRRHPAAAPWRRPHPCELHAYNQRAARGASRPGGPVRPRRSRTPPEARPRRLLSSDCPTPVALGGPRLNSVLAATVRQPRASLRLDTPGGVVMQTAQQGKLAHPPSVAERNRFRPSSFPGDLKWPPRWPASPSTLPRAPRLMSAPLAGTLRLELARRWTKQAQRVSALSAGLDFPITGPVGNDRGWSRSDAGGPAAYASEADDRADATHCLGGQPRPGRAGSGRISRP